MGVIGKRKNKKFGYEARYYKNDSEGSPFQMQPKFDKYRKTIGGNSGMKNKFKSAWEELKSNPDKSANRRILIIVSVLILIFLFIIEFDLSIFLNS